MKVKQLSGLSPRDRCEIGMENFAKNEVIIEFSWSDRNSGNLMKRTEGPGGEIL